MSDKSYLICYRVADLPHPEIESVRSSCRECKEPVHVTKVSFHMAKEKGLIIVCSRCHSVEKAFRSGNLQMPTQEQLIEVARSIVSKRPERN